MTGIEDLSRRLTRIHVSLGVPASPLTYELIEQAVAEKVVEADDLDWKRALPAKNEEAQDEFAKDVAALANARGGLLVYGVTETRGTGRAATVSPVSTLEVEQRRLSIMAATRVQPGVSGLKVRAIEGPDADLGVVVVEVPQSADAPHVIGKDAALGVPVRVDRDTHWMRERDLEAAYRERFRRRADEGERITELARGLATRLDQGFSWLTAVAGPRVASSVLAPRLARAEMSSTLQAALDLSASLLPPDTFGRESVIRWIGQAALNPSPGLRRWIATATLDPNPDSRSQDAHVEIHDDGSASFAGVARNWNGAELVGKHEIPRLLVENFVLDALCLVTVVAEARGISSSYVVRFDLERPDQAPFALLDVDKVGHFVLSTLSQPRWSRSVGTFQPVELEMLPSRDTEALLALAREVARDIESQFGFDQPSML